MISMPLCAGSIEILQSGSDDAIRIFFGQFPLHKALTDRYYAPIGAHVCRALAIYFTFSFAKYLSFCYSISILAGLIQDVDRFIACQLAYTLYFSFRNAPPLRIYLIIQQVRYYLFIYIFCKKRWLIILLRAWLISWFIPVCFRYMTTVPAQHTNYTWLFLI